MLFSHDTLENYYRTNFSLMQHHKYSLSDIESMVPYEREVYIAMLVRFLEEQKQKEQAAKK